MNIFNFTEEEIADMTGREFADWRRQWVKDFRNISAIIRQGKDQVAATSQIFDTIDDSSFMAAARSISQRNLCDSRRYANALMNALDDARAIRREARERAAQAIAEAQRAVADYGQALNGSSYVTRANSIIDELLGNRELSAIFMGTLERRTRDAERRAALS